MAPERGEDRKTGLTRGGLSVRDVEIVAKPAEVLRAVGIVRSMPGDIEQVVDAHRRDIGGDRFRGGGKYQLQFGQSLFGTHGHRPLSKSCRERAFCLFNGFKG